MEKIAGCGPGGPIILRTERKIVSKIWFKDVTKKDVRALLDWWREHTPHTYSYQSSDIKGLYDIVQNKVIWY
jgi:hypothetical protein